MVLLDNDGFLTHLTCLLQNRKSSGTVNITMKRYYGQTKPKPKPRGAKKAKKLTAVEQEGESKCLFRATDGKKKLSTVVNSKDVNRFQMVSLYNFYFVVFFVSCSATPCGF
ncbi:Signal recognition particle 14 kDa protein [Acropora cervicornis]|uniref:Signal recognition particle 14 kDa protein n=1 Tax=Acropora cervicornis TaxID=6130 RepID=A0AAD9V3Z4_ACRCE|nr:Signal recognition particle 14 kDa protein [Acropora cervicornis]